ncbi:MAG TPA: FUSC family protein [Steroidobacteraceae bacterium]|nr:FUSC family protein [Steroidobacteraceae bacterium]
MNNSGPRSAPLRARILAVLFQTKRAEVPWRVLLRNTAAAILPLAIGLAAGRVGIGLWISVGAIVTMYSDQPGPYRQRLERLLAVSAAGGFAAFVGMVLGGHLAPLLGAAVLISFAGALLVVFGDTGGRVGMAAIILLVITAASPAPGAWAALQSAALIACGGLLLTLFSIAAWPLQRYGPEREALASVYHGLAALARQRTVDSEAAPALSEGMTELQHTLLGSHRARGPVMDSFGVLLEESERIRLQLTALADGGSGERIGELIRREAADLLDHIGRSIASGVDVDHAMLRSLQALRSAERGIAVADGAPAESAPAAAFPDPSPTRHFHALCGQLAAAARNAGRASAAGALRAAEEELQLPRAIRPQSPLSILVASLTPRSVAFRHALRTAVCVAVALWLGRALELSHGYWIPMTVAIVLRADYGATFSYGLLRVAGTVMGLLLTTALVHFLPAAPWAWLAAMAVLCAAYRYYGPVHYGVAVAALSGMVVLLLALAGEPPDSTMVPRLIATVIGSAMALTAFGLWPTREHTQIRTALARLLRAYAAYLASLGAPGRAQERREARNAARVARANAEAALERLQAEPTAPPVTAELTRSLLANSNRLARTTMTLEAALAGPAAAPAPAPSGIQALTAQGASALERIAEAVERKAPPPPLSPRLRALQRELARELDTYASGTVGAELAALGDRLVDNINTLGHIVARASGAS